jgi:hypothetical protein
MPSAAAASSTVIVSRSGVSWMGLGPRCRRTLGVGLLQAGARLGVEQDDLPPPDRVPKPLAKIVDVIGPVGRVSDDDFVLHAITEPVRPRAVPLTPPCFKGFGRQWRRQDAAEDRRRGAIALLDDVAVDAQGD